ncbi:MAG: hypothetical protein ACR2PK_08125 [Acidimicrobiales bacterium]
MPITAQFDEHHFRVLLERWNQHHSLRTHGASVAELAASREHLDSARLQLYSSS